MTDETKTIFRGRPMPRSWVDPYAMPAVQPLADVHGRPPVTAAPPAHYTPEPLYEIMRQPLQDIMEGMDEHTLAALAQGAAIRAREAEQAMVQKWYREPFWYAVNIGEFGEDAAPILPGATVPSGRARIRMESGSNFEAYFAARYSRDETTLAINNARSFRSKVFYAGSKGVTSHDENATPEEAFMRNQNLWGSAFRPSRYVWPRIFPASTAVLHALVNDEANAANFQLVWWGNKVMCGQNPRKIVARPPFSREPFTYGITFTSVPRNQIVTGNVQMLEHADFELLYITQDSPEGSVGDFEMLLKEADGGNKGLSNIRVRRDAAYGTIERPTILTYPRYYARGSRILAEFVSRSSNLEVNQSFQIALHGNLII